MSENLTENLDEASEQLEAEVDDTAAYDMDDDELKDLLGDDFDLIDD